MAAKPPKKRLTPREQAFISYYLIDPNATQAARLAGYSPKTARQIGYENLTKPHIVAEIKRRRATMLDALQMDADEIVTRLTRHARGNLGAFLDDEGRFDLATARANGDLDTLKKLKITETVTTENDKPVTTRKIELELHDVQGALVTLAKRFNLFPNRVETNLAEELAKLGMTETDAVRELAQTIASSAAPTAA
jgi:phage terminase small subunit